MKAASILLLFISTLAWSSPEDVDRFAKCYKQFFGEVIHPSNQLLKSVKAGQLTGQAGCKSLLQLGNLNRGVLKAGDNQEAKKLLHTFNLLHNSFFVDIPRKTMYLSKFNRYIYDTNDRSYYLMNALFSTNSDGTPNYPFNKIFTDPETYKAVREGSNPQIKIRELYVWGSGIADPVQAQPVCGKNHADLQNCQTFPLAYQKPDKKVLDYAKVDTSSGYLVLKDANSPGVREEGKLLSVGGYPVNGQTSHDALLTTHAWNWNIDETIETGEIVGLEVTQSKSLPHAYQKLFNDSDGYWRNYLGPAYLQPYPNEIENVHDNLGAGIVFTPNYQAALGIDMETIGMQNGVDRVPRKWPQDVLKDFFCRDIPVIRQSDAVAHTAGVANPKAPFRNGASCMSCHATIDAMASISRNYQLIKTAPLGHDQNVNINSLHHPTHEDMLNLPTNPDPFFSVRPARGSFRYRDYAGAYHDIPMSSTPADPTKAYRDMGQIMAELDDPYICLTSKYFRYFTGIQTTFFDPGDLGAPTLSARDKAVRDFVYSLGKNLKRDGDVRKTILDIVSSELFLNPASTVIKK